MKNFKILFIVLFLSYLGHSQKFDVGIISGPMTTTAINAIASPQNGRLIGNSTTGSVWYYNGSAWTDTGAGLSSTDIDTLAELNAIIGDATLVTGAHTTNTDAQTLSISTDQLTISGGNTVTLPSGGTLDDDSVTTAKILDGTILSADLSTALADRITANDAKVTNTDDQDASEVAFSPNGSIASTTVQLAIQEVRDEAAGGSAPTGYHSNNTITADATAAYSNQVNGNGHRVVNLLTGTNDIDITIESIRAEANENYAFKSISATAQVDFLKGTDARFFLNSELVTDEIRLDGIGNADIFEYAQNDFYFTGNNLVEFTPANPNLYTENSGASGGTGVGSWTSNLGATLTRVVDADFDTGAGLQIAHNTTSQFSGARLGFLNADVNTWSGGTITQLDANDVYEITFKYKASTAAQQAYFAVRDAAGDAGQGNITPTPTTSLQTFTITHSVAASGSNSNGARLELNVDILSPYTGNLTIGDFSIIKTVDN